MVACGGLAYSEAEVMALVQFRHDEIGLPV